ncbi:hypothetical protein TNCV_60121 [Trichonephila clavipes]|nr:hypothetical protein TNCV_60121 [Trichonephila clavipes]
MDGVHGPRPAPSISMPPWHKGWGCRFWDDCSSMEINATFLTLSDIGSRNPSWQWARCTPVVSHSLEHHTILLRFPLNFEGEHPAGGQGPPTNLTRGLTAGRHLEYSHAAKVYTFTNIHAFARIQTDARETCQDIKCPPVGVVGNIEGASSG